MPVEKSFHGRTVLLVPKEGFCREGRGKATSAREKGD